MGYLKFLKSDGSVDLLPADALYHVSGPATTSKDITIDLGIPSGNDTTFATVKAVIAGADKDGTAADLTAASRNGINDAIIKAAQAEGLVVQVDLGAGLFCASITITDTAAA